MRVCCDTRSLLQIVVLGVSIATLASCRSPQDTPIPPPPRRGHTDEPRLPITYETDIAPMIARDCGGCHRHLGGAPFALSDYNAVVRRVNQLIEVVDRKIMPPELATGGIPFLGRHRVTPRLAETLRRWRDTGAPRSSDAVVDSPPQDLAQDLAQDFAQSSTSLGPPDQVVVEGRTFLTPAEGNGTFHTFVFPLDNSQRRYLRAIEYVPSDPRLLHGALFVGESRGAATRYDAATTEPGYPAMGNHGTDLIGSLGGWVVGQKQFALPAGYAWRIPPNTNVCVQVHWNPQGRSLPLTQRLQLHFDPDPKHLVTSVAIGNLAIDIPPQQVEVVHCEYTLPVAAELVGLFPQAHFVCSAITISAILPNAQQPVTLLHIADWDPNWMQLFLASSPMHLPAGSKVKAQFEFDNTSDNLQNPHSPPRRIRLGRMPDDELPLVLLHLSPLLDEDLEHLEQSHRRLFQERIEQLRR